MSLFEKLMIRSHSKCELCTGDKDLSIYEIPPVKKLDENTTLILCETCKSQTLDTNHWRCLNESMWSEYQPVQVMAFRMLTQLKTEPWARDLLEQLYLDDSILEWAKEGIPAEEEIDTSAPTIDSNGVRLMEGDSVTLIKDLEVKGGGFTAKRGTLVKNISLTNNPKHIEGRVNGIQIVLVAGFLKKAQ
ncbi:MAG TPA: PhnA domain-containing protein [Bacteriovoracaceae bacterium]|nr:PhnA domain-containing protein [Bacteriovoracaceae bacterium]